MLNLLFKDVLHKNHVTVCLATMAAIIVMMSANARAQPVATAPYTVAAFATAPSGLSAPDSVTFSPKNVFVGYGNGGAPDGSGGAMSNVVQYDFKGNIINNFTIVGHNDGLRYNPQRDQLWALQNEDGNSNLSIIALSNGQQTVYQLGTGPHGGGYDDIDFNNGQIFLSASAPTINPNTAPAIVSLKLKHGKVILSGIFNGNASATNVTTGEVQMLNLQDPDSMIVDPLGELVMTSQQPCSLTAPATGEIVELEAASAGACQ